MIYYSVYKYQTLRTKMSASETSDRDWSKARQVTCVNEQTTQPGVDRSTLCWPHLCLAFCIIFLVKTRCYSVTVSVFMCLRNENKPSKLITDNTVSSRQTTGSRLPGVLLFCISALRNLQVNNGYYNLKTFYQFH